jgi:hypothetical protein
MADALCWVPIEPQTASLQGSAHAPLGSRQFTCDQLALCMPVPPAADACCRPYPPPTNSARTLKQAVHSGKVAPCQGSAGEQLLIHQRFNCKACSRPSLRAQQPMPAATVDPPLPNISESSRLRSHLEAGGPHATKLRLAHPQHQQMTVTGAPTAHACCCVNGLVPGAAQQGCKALMLDHQGCGGRFKVHLRRVLATSCGFKCSGAELSVHWKLATLCSGDVVDASLFWLSVRQLPTPQPTPFPQTASLTYEVQGCVAYTRTSMNTIGVTT